MFDKKFSDKLNKTQKRRLANIHKELDNVSDKATSRLNVNYRRVVQVLLLLTVIVMSFGCATYKAGSKKAFDAVEKGNYPVAIKEMEKTIKSDGDDRLLYFLEVGLLKHLNGEYEASNRLLTRAAEIAEELETIRLSDQLGAALTSPRQAAYRGTKFERAFVHYYKALNYAFLAANNPAQKDKFLEGARIESRKVEIMLTALKNEKGTYTEVADKKKSTFSKLMKIFDVLSGNYIDKDKLVYREDAYIRYITGVMYESNGEYDDARISYQQAAELYEKGYQEQYQLESAITEQAWFDVVRMMRFAGGYESDWPRLAETKLSENKRKELDNYKKGDAQLMVIEHLGMIPAREEMNIHLTLDTRTKELVVRPVLTGTKSEKDDQMAWFFTMYSEKGLLSAIHNYKARGVSGVVQGLKSKRISIGAVWGMAEELGLQKAIGPLGIRITVPYYRPRISPYGESEVWVDGKISGNLTAAESLSQLALQEQLLDAGSDLQEALARELVKAILAEKASSAAGGGYLGLAAKLVNTATSQPETRNWLTLPQTIKITRLPITEGKHSVKLVTKNLANNQTYAHSQHNIELKKGQIYILRDRTIGRVKSTKAASQVKQARINSGSQLVVDRVDVVGAADENVAESRDRKRTENTVAMQ